MKKKNNQSSGRASRKHNKWRRLQHQARIKRHITHTRVVKTGMAAREHCASGVPVRRKVTESAAGGTEKERPRLCGFEADHWMQIKGIH